MTATDLNDRYERIRRRLTVGTSGGRDGLIVPTFHVPGSTDGGSSASAPGGSRPTPLITPAADEIEAFGATEARERRPNCSSGRTRRTAAPRLELREYRWEPKRSVCATPLHDNEIHGSCPLSRGLIRECSGSAPEPHRGNRDPPRKKLARLVVAPAAGAPRFDDPGAPQGCGGGAASPGACPSGALSANRPYRSSDAPDHRNGRC